MWRRPSLRLQRAAGAAGKRILHSLLEHTVRHHGPQGWIASTWPTGNMALWVLVLLLSYLLLYYLV